MIIGRNDNCPCGSGKKYKKCCLGKKPLTSDDLYNQLCEQISFIKSSCLSYDNGNKNEAKRISLALRILFHDTTNSKSLINQIDSSLLLLNTAPLIVDNGVSMFRSTLTTQKISGTGNKVQSFDFEPALDSFKETRPWNFIDFASWWNQIVLVDNDKISYTRAELILHMADTDGGAHVDSEQDSKYYDLTHGNQTGIQTYVGSPYEPENMVFTDINSKPHFPAIRQIAYEALISINHKYSEL